MKNLKKELLIDFSDYYILNHNLSPLTAKIYSYILLSCRKEGVTFEELVSTFCASKSSVSNSLNLLSKLKYIDHFSKIDERKRHYKVSPDSLLVRLEKVQNMLTNEKSLSERLKTYRIEELGMNDEISISKTNVYIQYLENALREISMTINQLNELKVNSI